MSRPDFEMMNKPAASFAVDMNNLIGETDDPTGYAATDEDGADRAERETAFEPEGLGSRQSRLSENTRRVVAASIREAYRVDRSRAAAGRV